MTLSWSSAVGRVFWEMQMLSPVGTFFTSLHYQKNQSDLSKDILYRNTHFRVTLQWEEAVDAQKLCSLRTVFPVLAGEFVPTKPSLQ